MDSDAIVFCISYVVGVHHSFCSPLMSQDGQICSCTQCSTLPGNVELCGGVRRGVCIWYGQKWFTWRACVRGMTAGRAAFLWAGWLPRARWRSVRAVLYCTPSSPAPHPTHLAAVFQAVCPYFQQALSQSLCQRPPDHAARLLFREATSLADAQNDSLQV